MQIRNLTAHILIVEQIQLTMNQCKPNATTQLIVEISIFIILFKIYLWKMIMDVKLNKLEKYNGSKGPLLLIIMDGVGFGKKDESDAVYLANTPTLDKLLQSKLKTKLLAHGPAVGLPSDDDMGNSEVGHNAMGGGRIFAQGAKLVQNSMDSGNIFLSDS